MSVCIIEPNLILLTPSLLIIFQYVVPNVVLRVDEKRFGLPLLLSALHPYHKKQHHACGYTHI